MTELVNTVLAWIVANGAGLGVGIILGAIITICWLYPPQRLETPGTNPGNSNRKAPRARVGGAR